MTKRYSEILHELRKAVKKRRKATAEELAVLKRIRDELAKGKQR
jgi:hypothetical protein